MIPTESCKLPTHTLSSKSEFLQWIIVDDTNSDINHIGRSWFSDVGSWVSVGSYGTTHLRTLHGTSSNASFTFDFTGQLLILFKILFDSWIWYIGSAIRVVGSTRGSSSTYWTCLIDGSDDTVMRSAAHTGSPRNNFEFVMWTCWTTDITHSIMHATVTDNQALWLDLGWSWIGSSALTAFVFTVLRLRVQSSLTTVCRSLGQSFPLIWATCHGQWTMRMLITSRTEILAPQMFSIPFIIENSSRLWYIPITRIRLSVHTSATGQIFSWGLIIVLYRMELCHPEPRAYSTARPRPSYGEGTAGHHVGFFTSRKCEADSQSTRRLWMKCTVMTMVGNIDCTASWVCWPSCPESISWNLAVLVDKDCSS